MTDYPRDEFDSVPESSDRQGVHRERLIPAGSSGLALKLTVGLLALLIGLAAYFILPRLGLMAGDGGPAPVVSATASTATPAAGGTPDASAETSPDATAGATDDATDDPTADATADSTPTAGGDDDAPDQSQTVNVLNGTGAPGLASVAAGRLAAAGWTSPVPGNWAGAPVDASVVFYNGDAQRDDAEAVAAELGITDLVESADISPDLSVVLGPEFQ